MTADDAKTSIVAALQRSGAEAPMAALLGVVEWAADSLAVGMSQDEISAFTWVQMLDDALPRLAELLGHVPELVSLASPGRTVAERLAEARSEVETKRDQLARDHAALTELNATDARLRNIETERINLKARIAQLQRRHRWAEELPSIRAQAASLEKALGDITDDSTEVAAKLKSAAERLLELTQAQRKLLGAQVEQILAEIESADEEVAELRDRYATLTSEADRRQADRQALRREVEQILPDLEARRQADQEIGDALAAGGLPGGGSGLARVRSELADIAGRLSSLETQLAPLLSSHAQAYREDRASRGWSS
jgi:DNA repair exonuclease SbcCD ATPase subunit